MSNTFLSLITELSNQVPKGEAVPILSGEQRETIKNLGQALIELAHDERTYDLSSIETKPISRTWSTHAPPKMGLDIYINGVLAGFCWKETRRGRQYLVLAPILFGANGAYLLYSCRHISEEPLSEDDARYVLATDRLRKIATQMVHRLYFPDQYK